MGAYHSTKFSASGSASENPIRPMQSFQADGSTLGAWESPGAQALSVVRDWAIQEHGKDALPRLWQPNNWQQTTRRPPSLQLPGAMSTQQIKEMGETSKIFDDQRRSGRVITAVRERQQFGRAPFGSFQGFNDVLVTERDRPGVSNFWKPDQASQISNPKYPEEFKFTPLSMWQPSNRTVY